MDRQSLAASSLASATQVHAHPLWNDVCTVVEGQSYNMAASGQWWDWFIRCGPDGYSWALLQPVAHLKRSPEDKWFCLMGAIDQDPGSIFRIGSARHWTATKSGTLSCFANDIAAMRWNNWGSVSIEVQIA
ncbi:hypothetical protein [Agrobacterium tumefaciens]|uniref:hypothetical protein n=1 Tax=Agrobacterium tumefaciens TaxID=358 RepID=UPI000976E506|nr:hypothetical protein BV900_14905 [Agrobacterium tumefaciens]